MRRTNDSFCSQKRSHCLGILLGTAVKLHLQTCSPNQVEKQGVRGSTGKTADWLPTFAGGGVHTETNSIHIDLESSSPQVLDTSSPWLEWAASTV
jgi:hypothetical protein